MEHQGMHALADSMRRVFESSHRGGYGEGRYSHRSEDEEIDCKMEDYFRRLHEGKTPFPPALCEIISTGIAMYMETKGTHHTERQHECGDAELHARYKDVIEQLRETKNLNEKERMIKAHFSDLTPDELAVLREKANAKSYKELAREKFGASGSVERWTEAMKNLKYKLNH
jgi:hypothetical protein